jgi:hypothetical protein
VELALLVLAALYIGAAAWLAWWMLEPINRVAGALQFSTRFMLTDVIGLMIMLQVPLAIVGRAVETGRDQSSSPYWILVTVFVALALVLWAAAVSVVSRAGITRLTRRLVVIVVLVPGALSVIIALPLCLAALASAAPVGYDDTRLQLFAILGLGGLFAFMVGIRRLSFWALAGSPGEQALLGMEEAARTQRLAGRAR